MDGAAAKASALQGFHDFGHRGEDFLTAVIEGLSRPQKQIPAKFFYDEAGSRLFEQITELDEYYPTRTERALLETWMPVWVSELRPATLVELGAGSAEKSRVALDAMAAEGCGQAYVPVDVSADFLALTADALREEYPGLDVVPLVADITAPIDLPESLPGPRWIAFLGSTLGNFEPPEALDLLEQQSYVQRTGELYEFLTDEEQDIEQEIKDTDVPSSEIVKELSELIFDRTIREAKISYEKNNQAYRFTRKIDGAVQGREYDLAINIISPMHDEYQSLQAVPLRSSGPSNTGGVGWLDRK